MSTLSTNKKYNSILETAKSLFWKYGIRRVTIEEICKEAGVSKMTFYKYFPNKIDLAKIIWNLVIKDALNEFRKVVDSDFSFQEKIQKMFTIKLQASENISLEFIEDIYKNPELGLQPMIEKFSNQSLQIFVEFITDSQKKGLIRKDIKVEFILHYFNQMSTLLDNKPLASLYEHPHDLIMESMNFLFYGLLSRE